MYHAHQIFEYKLFVISISEKKFEYNKFSVVTFNMKLILSYIPVMTFYNFFFFIHIFLSVYMYIFFKTNLSFRENDQDSS